MPELLAAPDKFRGTATAAEVAHAVGRVAKPFGWSVVEAPLSDGGEGLLEALATPGSHLETSTVAGPDGRPVRAEWRLDGDRAVVEMARASGLALAGGPGRNDPMTATTRGTGQLIAAAAAAVGPGGTVVVGLGGSATTDGGLGALVAVKEAGGLHGASLIGACDVSTRFVDAAAVFGPQKGADRDQIALLEDRLLALAGRYLDQEGIDVCEAAGSGAAGGLGGAILAMGGELRSGYALVAELVGLRTAIAGSDLVLTGEGRLDSTSFEGKVVGGVVEDATAAGLPVLVIVGQASQDGVAAARAKGVELVVLSEWFGAERSRRDIVGCVEAVVRERLAR